MMAYKKYERAEFCKEFGIPDGDFNKIVKHFNEDSFGVMQERRKKVEKDLTIQAIFGIEDPEKMQIGHTI